MSSSQPIAQTTTEEFSQDMVDLAAAIEALPVHIRPGVELAYSKVAESTRRRRRVLALVQEALGQLRLDMKYLVFDLEATRRERDEFKRQVDGDVPE
jgi:hypothetical protein